MANLSVSGQINGTTILCNIDVSYTRSGTEAYLDFDYTLKMNSSSARTDANYEIYTAYITVKKGSTVLRDNISFEVKPESVGMIPWQSRSGSSDDWTIEAGGDATDLIISCYVKTNKSDYGSTTKTNTSTYTLSIIAGYTKVGKPQAISLISNLSDYPNFLKSDGGTITFSWIGGTNGTANPLTGYRAEYSLDNGATWSGGKNINRINNLEDSFKFSFQVDRQGSKIRVRIKSLGTISGYDSDYYTSPDVITVNHKPVLNSVTVTPISNAKKVDGQYLVSSGGGDYSFTCKGTNTTGGTLRYEYSYDSGEDKKYTIYTNNTSLNFTETKTIYFRANDGIETSDSDSVIQVRIEKNVAPEFVNGTELTAIFSNPYEAGNSAIFYGRVNLMAEVNKDKYKYEITGISSKPMIGTSNTKNFSYLKTLTPGLSISQISIKIIDPNFEEDYCIGTFILKDDNGNEINGFSIPQIDDIKILSVSNNFDSSSNIEKSGNYFYNQLRVDLSSFNTAVKLNSIQFNANANTYNATVNLFGLSCDKKEKQAYKIESEGFKYLPIDTTFSLTFVFDYLETSVELKSEVNYQYVKNFLFSAQDKSVNFYGVRNQLPYTYPRLCFADNSDLRLYIDDKFVKTVTIPNPENPQGTEIDFAPTTKELYDAIGIDSINLTKQWYVRGMDVFERDLQSEPASLNIIYEREPLLEIEDIYLLNEKEEEQGFRCSESLKSETLYLIEGAKIKIQGNVQLYNGDANLILYRNGQEISKYLIESELPSTFNENGIINIPNKEVTYLYKIPELENNESALYSIEVINTNNSKSSDVKELRNFYELGQKTPVISNYFANWNGKNKYQFSFNLNSENILLENEIRDFKLIDVFISQTYPQILTEGLITVNKFEYNDLDLAQNYNEHIEFSEDDNKKNLLDNWTFGYSSINFKLKVTLKQQNIDFTLEKPISSNEFLIYNIISTFSLRQNYLGINTPNIDDERFKEALLVVTAYGGRDKIIFSNVEGDKQIIFDLSQGATEATIANLNCGGYESWMSE